MRFFSIEPRWIKRAAILSSGAGLLLSPLTVCAQTPPASTSPAEKPAPPAEQKASNEPGAEKTSPPPQAASDAATVPKEPAVSEVGKEPTTAETIPSTTNGSAEATQPDPEPAPVAATEPAAPTSPQPEPSPTTPAPPVQNAAPPEAVEEQPGVDDYDGATDASLVEEKPGPKNLSLGVAIDVTWPLGSTSDFIGNASIQGLSLDLRYYAWGNIGIGAGVALDSLSKKLSGTATWDNTTITGTQVRELSYTPITLKGYYAWRDREMFIPYVAAGLGAARAVRRLTVGISGLSEASWHFAVVPEAGLQIPIGPTLLLSNVRLNYLPPSGGAPEQIFANFSLGLSIQ